MTYPDGSEQTYAYDGAGRISSTTADGITVTYTYDALGNILTETYSNSILVTKTYDAAGNLATQKTEKNGTVLSQYTYGYDGNNSLVSETRILDGVTETLTHEYNERDELVKTTSTKNNVSETIQYTYTVTGNRATVVDGTTTQSFEYNDMNQLVEYSDSDYTYTLSYDDNGNRTQLTRNDGKKIVYTYDDQNRLISTVNQLGVSAEYLYDGLGNRIYEKQSYSGISVEWNYVNDYTSEYAVVLTEYNGSYNNLYYGNQRISGNGGTYLYDGQGNIIMIMGSGGGIAAGYEYSDYGVMSAEIDGFSNDDTTQVDEWVELWYNKYGYNGEAHTAEGLQYLRSRYYDPVTGSFISADSYRGEFSSLLSQNRYTYAHNNPYKYDDPTGHLPANGINKYASNALMDVGSGTSSNPTVKPPLPKPVNKPVSQSQNTNYNSGMLLRDVGRTPSVKTEAVMFDDGGDAGENSDDDDIGDKTAVTDNDSLQGDETEEVTGKVESSNVGTETSVDTGDAKYISNIQTSVETIPKFSIEVLEENDSELVKNTSFIDSLKTIEKQLKKIGNIVEMVGFAFDVANDILDGDSFVESLQRNMISHLISDIITLAGVAAVSLVIGTSTPLAVIVSLWLTLKLSDNADKLGDNFADYYMDNATIVPANSASDESDVDWVFD